jgi:hypothetical protein
MSYTIHRLQEIDCTDSVPTLCTTNAVNKQTLYSWISDLNVLQPHFFTQIFKYLNMFSTKHSWCMPRSPNTHLYLVVYFTKHIFYKRHAHTHAHTCIHLANKDELPLDNRVIGTLVNSFFEYSYAPTNVRTKHDI